MNFFVINSSQLASRRPRPKSKARKEKNKYKVETRDAILSRHCFSVGESLNASSFLRAISPQHSTINLLDSPRLALRQFSHKNIHALFARAARFISYRRHFERGRPIRERSRREALSSTPLKTRPAG